MKKIWKYLIFLIILIGGGYILGLNYYQNKFSANTQFASINIGSLTLNEAEQKINNNLADITLEINDNNTQIGTIKLGDLNPKIEFEEELAAMYQGRDPQAWPLSLITNAQSPSDLNDKIQFDKDKLIELLEDQGINNDERKHAIPSTIEYSEVKGYYIKEGKDGNAINFDTLKDVMIDAMEQEQSSINLSDAYETFEDVTDKVQLEKDFQLIEDIQSINFTYLIAGDEVQIPKETIASWLYLGEDNHLEIDTEAVTIYLDKLNEQYSTFGTYREFESTYQGTVQVPPGILGWMIDTELEVPHLVEDILAGKDMKRRPEIYSTGLNGGEADEIGDTYIEIDLTYQMMFLYVDGVQMIATDIVSGQPNDISKQITETVPGANAVNEMLDDTELIGYNPRLKKDYSVPVNYWIRFDDKAQGIHDASWQGAFGGDVYTYAGSLGCINTPFWAVDMIYQYVEIGTPVIVFN